MARRILRLLPNGREVTWGMSRIDGRPTGIIDKGETDKLSIDLSAWLDAGETITALSVNDLSGATVAAVASGQTIDVTVSGVTGKGRVSLLLTTSAGRLRLVPLGFRTPCAAWPSDPYRGCYSGC